jgi:putative N6-adenine-specific DNA methylase
MPLADLMCGGGTIAIEAAWIATRRPPGLTRPWFSFHGWPDFDRPLWTAIKDEARSRMSRECPVSIAGFDQRTDAIEFARGNTRSAGAFSQIQYFCTDFRHARPPAGPPGQILVNPPYGERIGEERELEPLYRDLGNAVKQHWPGWKLAVFTLHERLAKQIDLKLEDAKPFYNGKLPCKLYRFQSA